MKSLHDIQQQFAAAILADDDGPCAGRHVGSKCPGQGERRTVCSNDVGCGGASEGERLEVYRNNVRHNYLAALSAVYPVIERLVGAPFFGHAAGKYLREHPSHSGDIHNFGASFSSFLGAFAPAAALAYLPDTARLEWAMHVVFHAADPAPIATQRLAELVQCSDAALRCILHPACRLLASPFPLQRIWALNQPGAAWDEPLDIDDQSVRLLIRRRTFEVELVPLAAGEYALLEALAAGDTVSSAWQKAREADPRFQVASCLRRHIVEANIVDFMVVPPDSGSRQQAGR